MTKEDTYRINAQTWNNIADLYQQYFMDVSLYNETYDTFCSLLNKEDATVFEIGCGPGNITRYLLQKNPALQIDAVDIAPAMIKLAQQNNPAAHFRILDARDIHTITQKYDGVLCGFCIPYVTKEDAAQFIRNCSLLLHPGCPFYISAIEGDYTQSRCETGSSGNTAFVYYYEPAQIETWLVSNGFHRIQTFRLNYRKKDGSAQVHLVFIAVKK